MGNKNKLNPIEKLLLSKVLEALKSDLCETRNNIYLRAAHGRTEHLKVTLRHGAPVNAVNDAKQTALHMAAGCRCTNLDSNQKLECVQILLQHGASVHSRDEDGNTALHSAARAGNINCFKELVQAGAKTRKMNNDWKTALDLAPKQDQAELRAIIKHYRWSACKRIRHKCGCFRLNYEENTATEKQQNKVFPAGMYEFNPLCWHV